MMIRPLFMFTVPAIFLAGDLQAQGEGPVVKARLVYFQDAADNPADLYYQGADGTYTRCTPTTSVSAAPVTCPVKGGGVVFTRSGEAGPSIATAKVPAGTTEAVFFLLKAPGAGSSYQVLVVDESLKSLPRGSAFTCNLSSLNVRMTLGETKYVLAPGKPANIKRPAQRDGYNMAAFQVEAQDGEEWKPFKDTMMRFAETERYFILTHVEGTSPVVKIYKQVVPEERARPATGEASP